MKSNKSFINKGMQKQNMKQHGWLGIVFFIGLLFALPLQMFLLASDIRNRDSLVIENVFDIAYPFQFILIIFLPILAGIVLFRYLHVKSAVDMMHSLPIKRVHLYLNHYLTGTLLLLIPLWLVAMLLFFVRDISPIYQEITNGDIGIWTLVMTVMVLLFYSVSIFVGMMTGISVAQGILSFILLILPTALFYLIHANLAMHLYGYSRGYVMDEWSTYLSPIVWLSELNYREFSYLPLIFYALFCVIFIVLAYYLYQWRPLEMSGQTIVFEFLRPIFKYGVTVCTMLVGAVYFDQYPHDGWIIFGLIAGSLIGFLVAEMILKKTWHIWRKKLLVQYGVYASIILVLSVLIKTDVIGYETRVPEASEIERVFLGKDPWTLQDEQLDEEDIFIQDPTFIEEVRSFHEKIVTKQPEPVISNHLYEDSYVIAYDLENGSRLVRQYHIPMEESEEYVGSLIESKPYKTFFFELDRWEQAPIETITFVSQGPGSKNVKITDENEIEELRHILKYDIYSLTADDLIGGEPTWGSIKIETETTLKNEEAVYMSWNKSFAEVDEWLRRNDYINEARIVPEDIDTIDVIDVSSSERITYPEEYFFREKEYDLTEIQDEELIAEALQHSRNFGQADYVVRFTLSNHGYFFGTLRTEDVSEAFIQYVE